jgi:drug/metabolite transporter (DMT)-like permease
MNAARVKAWGLGLGFFSSVFFGTSGAFGKALIGAGVSPLQASWTRVAGAMVVVAPVVLVARRRAVAAALRGHWRLLLLYGVMGVAGCQSFYFVAASRLPVGIAILLEYTGPVLVVVFTRVVLRTQLPRSAAVGVGIALIGLACVVEVWTGLRLDLPGVLAGLGAAACQAGFFLAADRASGRIDPLVMAAAGFVIATIVLTVCSAPWHIPWHVFGDGMAFGDRTAPGWFLLALLVLISTVTAYITSIAAVQRLSAPVAGAVGYVEAVAAALFAWATLGEHLSAVQLAGGLVVLAGAFVAQRSVAVREDVLGGVPAMGAADLTRAGG